MYKLQYTFVYICICKHVYVQIGYVKNVFKVKYSKKIQLIEKP